MMLCPENSGIKKVAILLPTLVQRYDKNHSIFDPAEQRDTL